MRNELNNNNKTRRRTNMVTNKKTNKLIDKVGHLKNPSGAIYTNFNSVEEKERFEKETGFTSGQLFTISNRQYRTLKKRCRRGKTTELLSSDNITIFVKKYGKDLYKDIETGIQVMSSKMVDDRVEALNSWEEKHNGVSEVFADNEMGHISQSLSENGYNRDEINVFLDSYLTKKHNTNYKEVA
jgi:hypothetical protein